MGDYNISHSLCKTGSRLVADEALARFGSGGARPLLSIVLASRADSYRGDPMKHACMGLRSIAFNSVLLRMKIEVVFVDYNSPSGRSVSKELRPCIEDIAGVDMYLTLRVVVVPLWVLQVSAAIAADKELLPFNEWVAKNVGIRRAHGTYIIVSNPEVILPSALWQQFAKNSKEFFRIDLLISSDRRDSWTFLEPLRTNVFELPQLERQLDAGVRVIWSHLHQNGSTLPGALDTGLAPEVYYAALKNALHQCPWKNPEVRWQGNGTSLAATFSGVPAVDAIHHTGSGDFLLAHRAVWMRVRGYYDVWSFDRPPIDSLTVSKILLGLKMRQMVLRGQFAIWHYSDGPYKVQNAENSRPRVSDVPAHRGLFIFFKWISQVRGSALDTVNSCTWGLCSPFSALELPFTSERLFRCGSDDSSATCLRGPEQLIRMCSSVVQYPIRYFDLIAMPALQLLGEDFDAAAANANFGCRLILRNMCANNHFFGNGSRVALLSTTCCANLAAAKLHPAPILHDDLLKLYSAVVEEVCGRYPS
jgi:hypothetical protein